jgi:predicted AlkP superfamily phosphohydrolase/phosphomutase
MIGQETFHDDVYDVCVYDDDSAMHTLDMMRKKITNRLSLRVSISPISLPLHVCAQIGTFIVAFGLEHYMHHKYHSSHGAHDGGEQQQHQKEDTNQSRGKEVAAHAVKEFNAQTASLEEITVDFTRLRERVSELRKQGKHV